MARLRRGIRLLTRFAQNKLAGWWVRAQLYTPRPDPAGTSLRIGSASSAAAAGLRISAREVLPARPVRSRSAGTVEAPPLRVFVMDEATLISDSQSFLAFLVNSTVIAEISTDYRAKPGLYTSVTGLQRLPPSWRIASGVSLLTGHGGDTRNYFHWLFDVLPRLHLMEMAGLARPDATYIVPIPKARYQTDTLVMLGIPPEQTVPIGKPTTLVADRLAVAEGHRSHGHVEAWVCEFLRSRLGSAGSSGKESPQRIYVNRGDALVRRVTNEDRLEVALAARGFASISVGSLSFREQVDLFEAAEVVVGPHGAGLANLVFCRHGTRVVELGGGGHSWPLFEGIARSVDLDYRLADALKAVGSPRLPTRVRDTRIDLDRALTAIDDALT